MQALYVVEFTVESGTDSVTESARGTFEATLEVLAKWTRSLGATGFTTQMFERAGSVELVSERPNATRGGSWVVVLSEDVSVVRLDVRDVAADATTFSTRVTVGLIRGKVQVRVSMAREMASAWLSPTREADIRQPRVVHMLIDDRRLQLRIANQVQDGRYLQVRTDDEIDGLAGAIRTQNRLPLLIVHARTTPAMRTTRIAADRLIGLARVVTVDARASRSTSVHFPDLQIPYGGGLLVWSDYTNRPLTISPSVVNGDREAVRSMVIRRLAPLTVLTRGQDNLYREALAALRLNDVYTAHAQTPKHDYITLEQELNNARRENQTLSELLQIAEDERDQSSAEASLVTDLQAQVAQLQIALASVHSGAPQQRETDPWDDLPNLETSDETSANALFLRLEELAAEHIAFSPNASRSWKRARYPFPEEMQAALVTLTRVSMEIYGTDIGSIGHLDTWIKENFGLKVALADDTIEKNRKLRYFDYDDLTYDRTPHVKVRDNAPHQHVGRIHFALDQLNRRLVVDHVGIKLY